MKSHRFQYSYRENASKLHIAVGEILRQYSCFCSYESYQEYPVNRINPNYPSSREHFDWVVPTLHLVIECHGIQHYQPTAFDGDRVAAIAKFEHMCELDKQKYQAAIDAGYVYMIVHYKELAELTGEFLWQRYITLLNSSTQVDSTSISPLPTSYTVPTVTRPRVKMYYDKSVARFYRKAQYERFRKWQCKKKAELSNGSQDSQSHTSASVPLDQKV